MSIPNRPQRPPPPLGSRRRPAIPRAEWWFAFAIGTVAAGSIVALIVALLD